MIDFPPSRRAVMAGAGALALAGCATRPSATKASSTETPVQNPVVLQRADAQISRHESGVYYMTASVPEYDRLILRRSPTIAGLATAEERVLWRRPATGKMGGHIWAPEVHEIDGRWYMYFAAGDAGDRFHIRTYVLQCKGPDPMTGDWEILGQMQVPWDTFNLDSTTFVHKGQRYFLWAQSEPTIRTNSNLYLAPLATPTTLARTPVCLSVPELPWEIQGFKVNEGAAVLARNGRLFMTYSASATDARYCLGMLTADADADIMDPKSWTKSQEPVFVTNEVTGVYGPGHNSFTVDEQGRDVMVYHGRDYRQITGDPLYDPNRHTRVQRIYYRADGAPDFGVPVGNGEVPDRFSPADQPGAFLRHQAGRLVVGDGDIAGSQLRQKPGLAGAGTVSFEPILERGKFLRRAGDGSVVVSAREESPAFAQAASFRRVAGLSGQGVSFEAVGQEKTYLRAVGGQVSVGPVGRDERKAATFLIT
jgi:GH43 family beta-xylosidase